MCGHGANGFEWGWGVGTTGTATLSSNYIPEQKKTSPKCTSFATTAGPSAPAAVTAHPFAPHPEDSASTVHIPLESATVRKIAADRPTSGADVNVTDTASCGEARPLMNARAPAIRVEWVQGGTVVNELDVNCESPLPAQDVMFPD